MNDLAPRAAARVALLCAGVCVVGLAIVTIFVVCDRLTAIDTRGILALRTVASPDLTVVMLAASRIAHGTVAIPLALLLAALIARFGSQRDALLYAGACLSGEAVQLGLKAAVRHHRPTGISPKLTDAGWYSFPSGHATMAVVVFGLGAFLLTRRSTVGTRAVALGLALGLVILVAFSRVYLGAHWPSDVVGSLFAGTAWTALCVWWALRRGGAAPRVPAQSP